MALKDLLQSQKTIRELKTETAALRLERPKPPVKRNSWRPVPPP